MRQAVPRRHSALALATIVLALALSGPGSRSAAAADVPTRPIRPPTEAPAATPALPAPPSRDIFCPVCGARNHAGSSFCLKDGVALPRLDPERYVQGFSRASETYSPEEIQDQIRRAEASVVRIRVTSHANIRYPVVERDERPGHPFGHLATLEGEAGIAGSGFVISPQGEVVTNAHVAGAFGAEAKLTVESLDGRSFPAHLVGLDYASDLALLRADTGSIPPIPWGDESHLHLGEETWAIGNPLDIGISVTRGTISTTSRMRAGMNQIESYLHSDAFITHGNSGGPLVDVLGRVIGISDMGFHEEKGQGYSIPAGMARRVVDRLRQRGKYERGYLGLHVRPIDSDAVKRFSLKRFDGVVVDSILDGSPAAGAGFLPGDVLFGINGHLATASYLFQEAVSSVGPGVVLKLALDRAGKVLEVAVTTAPRPQEPRLDPLLDFEGYLMARFEEDPKGKGIVLRVADRFSIAPKYGLTDGSRFQRVVPAQDWPPDRPDPARKVPGPTSVRTLEELRTSLRRAYLGGRVGITFILEADRERGASVAFDEIWPIII